MLKVRAVNFGQKEFQIHTLHQNYPGQTEWILGRNITSDLVLPNLEVSRLHGRIFYREDSYHFIDLGSTCGTVLNGENVTPHLDYALKLGDLLQIGDTFLHLEDLSPPFLLASEPESPRVVILPEGATWTTEDLTVRCVRIVDETPTIKTFDFIAEPPVLFNYQPGQFVNLEVEIDHRLEIRPYSISSSPTRPYSLSLTVKRLMRPTDRPDVPDGLVSNWLHDHLQVGDCLKLAGGAMGNFTCLPELPPKLMFVAAGSGITPMMSMARWIYDALPDCDLIFLYSARTPAEIPFRTELENMAAQMPNFHLAVTITGTHRHRAWMGLTGRIAKSMLHLVAPDLLERTVYVCGPDTFMADVKAILQTINFPTQNYREESFGNSPVQAPHPKSQTKLNQRLERLASMQPQLNQVTTVYFAQSQKEVIADSTSSILELAEQEGIQTIRQRCRMGVCGACKVFTCNGKVRYSIQPQGLSQADQEAGYALACVACPVENLTVEA